MESELFAKESICLSCTECNETYPVMELRYFCDCGGLLQVLHPLDSFKQLGPETFDARLTSRDPHDISGVWRFREVILDVAPGDMITQPEGRTRLYQRSRLSSFGDVEDLHLKHEGDNPTGSFKDRGMTCAITQANRLGMKIVGCASTGNTSAALASYAACAGMKALVFLPAGKVALGKIAQAVGYGATCLAIGGDFDEAMAMVRQMALDGDLYMVNSLNPFRLEGQKSVMWEMLQDLEWEAPDWVVVPGGNLGNTSAFGKALLEAYAVGWIQKLPRIATIQAEGANPFYQSYKRGFDELLPMQAETVATAVRIGNPVNYSKALKVIRETDGVVVQVSDSEIMAAKALIDGCGIGCEPASACSLAGVKTLRKQGVIKKSDKVVGVLTGHMLKDPDAILKNAAQTLYEIRSIEEVKGFLSSH